MNTRKVAAFGMILLVNPFVTRLAFADASYQDTTQITGGSLVDTMKSMSFLSKSIKEMLAPTNTLTMVHGNQKATVSKESTEIIDLDKGAMIHIDTVKKTYSVVTFAQMQQAFTKMEGQMQQMQAQNQQQMKQAQDQMKQAQNQPGAPQLKTSFDVAVKNTGVTKVVNGLTAQEQIITMSMKITDPNAPPDQANAMAYTVTTDAWIAPDPPQIKEIQDFDIRMGQKMMEGVDMSQLANSMKQMQATGNAMTSQLFAGQPGASDAMAQMGKEMAKIKGTRVLEVTSMGGIIPPQPAGSGTAPAPAPPPPPPPAPTSTMGAIGSALGGSILGGFHKKKAPDPAPAAAAPAAAPADGSAPAAPTSVVMMSTTTQKTNFSAEAIPLSVFQVPAGFKQVPSPYEQMAK